MKRIVSNKRLNPGQWYWCHSKYSDYHEPMDLLQCKVDHHNTKYIAYGGQRIWAEDENNQALERWIIFGPVKIPTLKDMCSEEDGLLTDFGIDSNDGIQFVEGNDQPL